MKLEKILFKNILILNIIVILITFITSLSLRITQIIKDENDYLFLTSKMFETYLDNTLSKIYSYSENILEKNDIVFIFDKNPLIKNFSLNALELEFNNIIKNNSFINGITITDNNNIILKTGNIDIKNPIYLSNNCFCINIINNISENKFIFFTLNLNDIFNNFMNTIEKPLGLLINYNNN
ncbi:hypothetical protein, partial [Marinitoga sp. 38H-ov]|uniref:hypothetical protein n=1 Tax=Marinitoga sp. 38H-ov TaxID=1755814 RepID=UPI0013EE3648